MKKTLIATAMAAFISTGAIAAPMPHNAHGTHANHHSVHMVNNHSPRPAPHVHHYAPAPVVVHHSHHHHNDAGAILLGDAIIAFAILASNAM